MDKPTLEQIRAIAESFNNSLDNPLPNQEIKHITKSIHKYVSKPKNQEQKEKLSERQRERGKKSGVVRAEKAQKNKDQAFIYFANKNLTQQAIADKLGVSLPTVKKYSSEFKKVYRTISGSPPSPLVCAFSKENQSIKIEDYLADTFSLYAEREDTAKIPLNTINRLLE
jgi:transcriptional regulator with XRE-family HTH domain